MPSVYPTAPSHVPTHKPSRASVMPTWSDSDIERLAASFEDAPRNSAKVFPKLVAHDIVEEQKPSVRPLVPPPPMKDENPSSVNTSPAEHAKLSPAISVHTAGTLTDSASEEHKNGDEESSELDLDVHMSGGRNNSWFDPNGLGPFFGIMNFDGDVLYYAGQLCGEAYENYGDRRSLNDRMFSAFSGGYRRKLEEDGGDDVCGEIELDPGTYKFRVTGALYPFRKSVRWSFCHVNGNAQEELIFRISKVPILEKDNSNSNKSSSAQNANIHKPPPHPPRNPKPPPQASGSGGGSDNVKYRLVCAPLILRNVTQVCNLEAEEAYYGEETTLEGGIHLGGNELIPVLTEADHDVIRKALAHQFSDGLGSGSVKNSDVEILSWDLISTTNVQGFRYLSATLGRLSFRVRVNADFSDNSLRSFIHGSMSSGMFVANLVSKAHKDQRSALTSVNFAELVELVVLHETRVNESLSGVASAVIAVSAFLGLVLGIALFYAMSSRKSQYTALSPTSISHSQHDEVLPSNMYSISRIHDIISSEEHEKGERDGLRLGI